MRLSRSDAIGPAFALVIIAQAIPPEPTDV